MSAMTDFDPIVVRLVTDDTIRYCGDDFFFRVSKGRAGLGGFGRLTAIRWDVSVLLISNNMDS